MSSSFKYQVGRAVVACSNQTERVTKIRKPRQFYAGMKMLTRHNHSG